MLCGRLAGDARVAFIKWFYFLAVFKGVFNITYFIKKEKNTPQEIRYNRTSHGWHLGERATAFQMSKTDVCIVIYFSYAPFERGKVKQRKQCSWLKKLSLQSNRSFCPGSFYPFSSIPFSLGTKGSALSQLKSCLQEEVTHLFPHQPFIFQCESISGGFFPEEKNLLRELWLTSDGGGEIRVPCYLRQ